MKTYTKHFSWGTMQVPLEEKDVDPKDRQVTEAQDRLARAQESQTRALDRLAAALEMLVQNQGAKAGHE